jgi:hypothetical protein
MNTLWIDKYTPKTLDDIIGHIDNINKIKLWLEHFYNKKSKTSGSIIVSGIHGIFLFI